MGLCFMPKSFVSGGGSATLLDTLGQVFICSMEESSEGKKEGEEERVRVSEKERERRRK